MTTPEDQASAMRGGIRRLLLLAVPSPTAYVQNHLTGPEKMPRPEPIPEHQRAVRGLHGRLHRRRPGRHRGVDAGRVRARARRGVRRNHGRAVLHRQPGREGACRQSRRPEGDQLGSSLALLAPLADAREQHDGLIHPGFISATGLTQLRRLPVYLAGISHRVGKLAENLGRDRVWMAEVRRRRRSTGLRGGPSRSRRMPRTASVTRAG